VCSTGFDAFVRGKALEDTVWSDKGGGNLRSGYFINNMSTLH
jgi:hypothetical protein